MSVRKITFPVGYTPKILLLGNGFNRAYDLQSLDDLLASISDEAISKEDAKSLEKVPFPLRTVILTQDKVDEGLKRISQQLCDLRIGAEENELLRRLISHRFDSILTTNYTYELERAIDPDFKIVPGTSCKHRMVALGDGPKYDKAQFKTYFYFDENHPPIWHIHGEAAKKGTMVLGHYYYGKLLSKAQQSINPLKSAIANCKKRGLELVINSWVDLFLLGDVHIIGLGMDFSEMDLWWLVNCKKRHFPNSKVTLYKPDITREQELLARAYNVEVDKTVFENKYRIYYHEMVEKFEKGEIR